MPLAAAHAALCTECSWLATFSRFPALPLSCSLQNPFHNYEEELKDKGAEAHCYLGTKAENITIVVIPELYHPQGCWAQPASGSDVPGGGASDGGSGSTRSGGDGSVPPDGVQQASGLPAPGEEALPGRLLRSDYHLYRNGTYLHLERCCAPEPWRLAAGPGPTRAMVYGDSTARCGEPLLACEGSASKLGKGRVAGSRTLWACPAPSEGCCCRY